ncbi:ABC transporter ATP-binding protein [Cryobacterium melibiosiphilum]|uniref:ABC transporter ATP-binding protein n=1 Tax=Cryobacterium melibiosiphilum TaxID=995039 RepID=A0A3A5MHU0_9MICO|nr:ABC transporter ATP-binding protein [Cryobacterium melibiosiphilum]RJT88972.1 ABC transporter ATP-binding protein [Cryobacterium melibiosiphilum]
MSDTQIVAETVDPHREREVILDVRDLAVDFTTEMGRVSGVQGVSFTLHRGETLAIVGESGSGKTTTVNAVLGLLPGNGDVTSGEIFFRGTDIAGYSEKALRGIRGKHIGLVPQDPMSNLNPVMRVGDQLAEVLLAHGKATRKDVRGKVNELLARAGLPDAPARARQYPHEFSGGMRQRALIAIGLACQPELLIADEPTSALDVTVQRTILDHLSSLTHDLGTAMILVTHDLGLAAERAETVIVMNKGRIVEQGPSAQILRNPQHEYTRRLVESAPSLASARMKPINPAAVTGQIGEASVILHVRDLVKEYTVRSHTDGKRTTFKAVTGVNFDLHRGTTLAIVGESGSGKSTTARIALRLEEPTSGLVEFNGTNIAHLRGRDLKGLRKQVQPIFQDPYASLNPMASVGEILEEPLKIYRLGNRAARRERAMDLLEMVALDASIYDRFATELSGGQRQRIAIARALALEPDLIICDEPVSALDVLVQAQILELLMKLQTELGLSYLFISHDLAVVRLIADQIVVMKAGEIVERGAVVDVFTSPQHEYTRMLLDSIPHIPALDAAS